MVHPVVRWLLAVLFTMVMITVTFVLVGLAFARWIGPLGMMTTLLLSGVIWWVVAMRLFRLQDRR